jgi:hypothetical protein
VRTRRLGTFVTYAIVDRRVADIVRLGDDLAVLHARALGHCLVIAAEVEVGRAEQPCTPP